MGSELSSGYDCSLCGQHHDTLPLSFSAKMPVSSADIPDAEVATRIASNVEQCIIDGKDFFMRGRIAIPVHGLEEPFIWGVWVKLIEPHFRRADRLWRVEGREAEPPFPGWLDTNLPIYGDTRFMRMMVQTRPVGERPRFYPADPNHPIAIEQRIGMSLKRAEEIAARVQHGNYDIKI